MVRTGSLTRLAAVSAHLAPPSPEDSFHWVGEASPVAPALAPSGRLLLRSIEDRELANALLLATNQVSHLHSNGYVSPQRNPVYSRRFVLTRLRCDYDGAR